MTFNVYIRITIEIFLLMIVSSINELYLASQLDNSKKIASYWMNFLIILFWGAFFGIWVWLWSNSHRDNKYQKYYLKEFFLGTKNNKRSKFYTTMFLSKRIILVSLVILLERMPMILKVIIFILIQLWSWVTIIYLRPFKDVKNNIIEILNEVYFLLCSSVMIHFNKKSKWSSWQTTLYINILLSNIIAFSILSIGKILWVTKLRIPDQRCLYSPNKVLTEK